MPQNMNILMGGGVQKNFWIFWIFLNSCSSGTFFLECNFCFWIFWILALPEPGFFGVRSFLFFLVFGEGGGVLPGLLDFLNFLEFLQFWALFGMKFLFLDFLDFLQFRAFLVKTLLEPGFFFVGMRSFVLFLGLRGGGGGLSKTFGFFWIFLNSCSSGPFFLE